MHLTPEQDGIYLRLIMHYMETRGPIPDNDAALARIAGVSVEIFASHSLVIREFFTSKADGKLQLKRCDEILDDQAQRSKVRSVNGKKGGRGNKAEKPKENNGTKATGKLNGSTSHHITSQDIDNIPLTPLNGNHRGFDILNLISDDGLIDARSQAPGWDIQGFMVPIYNTAIREGKMEKPRYPNKAFPAWCKSYTKGKRPQ